MGLEAKVREREDESSIGIPFDVGNAAVNDWAGASRALYQWAYPVSCICVTVACYPNLGDPVLRLAQARNTRATLITYYHNAHRQSVLNYCRRRLGDYKLVAVKCKLRKRGAEVLRRRTLVFPPGDAL